MKIAICDDSASDANFLKVTCLDILGGVPKCMVDVYTDGKCMLDLHQKIKYDIVFLDVDMPFQNGIELGKTIKAIVPRTIIIFYTSYPQYAIDAYDCEAFHYLLKPCDRNKLAPILDRAQKKLFLARKKITVGYKNKIETFFISDIYYVEYLHKHIIYHLEHTKIECLGKISDVYDELNEFGFYQVHQGYIVNFDKVCRFEKDFIILSNGTKVMVSVRKRKEAIWAYSKYVEKFV